MDAHELQTLGALFGEDLAGWQINQAHFLELDHTLMGTFPAVNVDDEDILVLDKGLLERVWQRINKRPARVTSFLVIAHPESGIAFSLEEYSRADAKPLRIFSAEDIDELCQEEGLVAWARGLVQGDRPIQEPVFV